MKMIVSWGPLSSERLL